MKREKSDKTDRGINQHSKNLILHPLKLTELYL